MGGSEPRATTRGEGVNNQECLNCFHFDAMFLVNAKPLCHHCTILRMKRIKPPPKTNIVDLEFHRELRRMTDRLNDAVENIKKARGLT